MTTCAEVLHAAVFGFHLDVCPDCGRKFKCSDPYDCQHDRLCLGCHLKLEPPDDDVSD